MRRSVYSSTPLQSIAPLLCTCICARIMTTAAYGIFVLASGQETRTSSRKKNLQFLRHNLALSDLFVNFHFWSNKFLSHCYSFTQCLDFYSNSFEFEHLFFLFILEYFWSFSFFVSIRHIDCGRGLNFLQSNCYLLPCIGVWDWIELPFSIRCKRKIIIIVAFRSDKDTNRHNKRRIFIHLSVQSLYTSM